MVTEAKKPSKWAVEPFLRFQKYLEESGRILVLSMKGLGQIARMPPLAEALAYFEREEGAPDIPTEEERQRLEQVREDARFAEVEEEQGFPRLHAHAVVDVWSALEVLREDLVVAWLVNVPESLSNPEVAKIRLPISETEATEKEDRMRLVYRELERNLKTNERLGVNRIEVLLSVVGLPGKEIPEEVKRNIFEMQQIRNTIVHKGSIADKRLVEACPWLGLAPGAIIRVTHEDYGRYVRSVGDYVLGLINRARAQLGLPPVPDSPAAST